MKVFVYKNILFMSNKQIEGRMKLKESIIFDYLNNDLFMHWFITLRLIR